MIAGNKLIAWPSLQEGCQSEWSAQALYSVLFGSEGYEKKEMAEKASLSTQNEAMYSE